MQTVLPGECLTGRVSPVPGIEPGRRFGKPSQEGEQQQHRVLGDVDGVEPRHVGDPDACRGCRRDVDVLDACAELLNQAELSGVDGFGVQFGPEWNDDVDQLVAGALGKCAWCAPLHVNCGLVARRASER